MKNTIIRTVMRRVSLMSLVLLLGGFFWMMSLDANVSNDPIPGSFTSSGFRRPPVITDFKLFSGTPGAIQTTDLTGVNGSMTPQLSHFVEFKVEVVNPNRNNESQWFNTTGASITPANINADNADPAFITSSAIEIIVKVFFSDEFGAQNYTPTAVTGDAVSVLEDEFAAIETTHPDYFMARVLLTRDENLTNPGFIFEIIDDGSYEHTWIIVPEDSRVTFENNQSFTDDHYGHDSATSSLLIATFQLVFKPSKTSLESLDSTDLRERNWVAAAQATDLRGPVASNIESSIQHGMQWYGEVSVPNNARIDWGSIDILGLNNNDSDYTRTTIAEPHVQYISNGPYQHTFSGDPIWTGRNTNVTAALITTPTPDLTLGAQEFMIRVNQDFVLNPSFLLQSIQLQLPGTQDSTTVQGLARGLNNMLMRTEEIGRYRDFSLFLRVGPAFQNDVYEGSIQVGIRPLLVTDRIQVDTATVRKIMDENHLPISDPDDLNNVTTNNLLELNNANSNTSGTVFGMPTLLNTRPTLLNNPLTRRYVILGQGPYRSVFAVDDLLEREFVLTGDIDFSNGPHTPIGTPDNPFVGSIDGQGFAIKNLVVRGDEYAGLFGYAEGGSFKNLVITGVSIEGRYAGALMGQGVNVTIENVRVSGTVKSNDVSLNNNSVAIGGIAGILSGTGAAISQSTNFASIEITSSDLSDVKTSGMWNQAGGIVGSLQGSARASSNLNQGTVLGNSSTIMYLSGIANASVNTVIIEDNLNVGSVGLANGVTNTTTDTLVAGITALHRGATVRRNLQLGDFLNASARPDRFGEIIVGYDNNAAILNSLSSNYFRIVDGRNISAVSSLRGYSAQATQARGLTDSYLKRVSSFVGWDFENTWGINNINEDFNNTFPFPLWQVEQDDYQIFDIRADVFPPAVGARLLSGTQNFVYNATVGPNHPVDEVSEWRLELFETPVDYFDNDKPLTEVPTNVLITGAGARANANLPLNTLLHVNEPYEYRWQLTVWDSEGNENQVELAIDMANPTANGQVVVLQESDTQIIVNFDQRTSVRAGTDLLPTDFELIVYGFNKTITEPVPDPTVANFSDAARGLRPRNITNLIASAQIRESDGSPYDPNGSGNTQLVLTLSEPFRQDPANKAVGEYFRLEFKRPAQIKLVNPGNNPLRTEFTRDLVRPLMIRVADFTSGGMSGTSGWFPRGYTFSVTEPVRITSVIGGMNGSANNVLLAIWETQNPGSTTIPANSPGDRIKPVNVNNPLVWIRTSGSGNTSQIEFEANAILMPNKTYLLLQLSFDGDSNVRHHRASGDIDFQQIENFNTRIFNWGPNNGLNWRFTEGGVDNLMVKSSTQSENTRPALGFRYVVPTEAELSSAGITFSNGVWEGNPVADIRRENSDWTKLVVKD